MKLPYLALLILAVPIALAAQTPTWFTVASEGDTVTLAAPATVRYGTPAGVPVTTAGATVCSTAGGCWDSAVVETAGPLTVGTAAFGGVDPAVGTVKVLQVEETASAQSVTLNGQNVPVPALGAATVACALPTTFNANPSLPATPPNCAPNTPAVAIATDGQVVGVMGLQAQIFFQYCQGAVCDSPFMFISQPLEVGPTAAFGGPPGGSGAGTLYAIQGAYTASFIVSPGPVANVAVPPAP